MKFSLPYLSLMAACVLTSGLSAREPDVVVNVWPGKPPGAQIEGEEIDTTKPDGNKIAGKRLIRLGNVSTPTISVFKAPKEKNTGAAVVICPGGGYHILAWDLEGTEVAEWLNTIGVTGIVLKYRVPTRRLDPKWLSPLMDSQRAMSVVRSRAKEWGIEANKIGVLGFSAGGNLAGLTATMFNDRKYEAIDKVDKVSARPDVSSMRRG